MLVVDKKKLSEEDFELLLDAERLAFHSYRIFVKEKLNNEYVDVIASTLFDFYGNLDYEVPIYYEAKNILNNDYNLDFYSLPFYNEKTKLRIKKYDLIKELSTYMDNNKIKYKSDKILNKAQQLSSNNKYIKDIMNKINNIDDKLYIIDNTKKIEV